MGNELEGHEEEIKAKIHIDSLRAILQKVLKWKTSGLDGIHGYWF